MNCFYFEIENCHTKAERHVANVVLVSDVQLGDGWDQLRGGARSALASKMIHSRLVKQNCKQLAKYHTKRKKCYGTCNFVTIVTITMN